MVLTLIQSRSEKMKIKIDKIIELVSMNYSLILIYYEILKILLILQKIVIFCQ